MSAKSTPQVKIARSSQHGPGQPVAAWLHMGVHIPEHDVYGTVIDISPATDALLIDLDNAVIVGGQEVDGMVWFQASQVEAY